jgi:hypothetical protein
MRNSPVNGGLGSLFLVPRSFQFLVFGEDFCPVEAVVVIREFQKDQPEHWRGILAGFVVGVGSQIINGTPECSREDHDGSSHYSFLRQGE